jgi:hypothetical protein
MMSAWGPNGDVVYMDSIPTHLIYDDEQQTVRPSLRAGGVEQKGPSLPATCSAPSPSTLPGSTLEPSKAAAPFFSVEDRLQLIADGE